MEKEQIFTARTDTGDDIVARFMVPFGDMVHSGHASAAAHADDLLRGFERFDAGSTAKGAAHVKDAVALVQIFQHLRGTTEYEVHDSDGAVLLVGIGDGERETLTMIIHAKDDEMARAGRGGYLRRIQNQLAGAARDELFLTKNLGRHGGILNVAV